METVTLLVGRLGGSPSIDYVDALSLAGGREILKAIRAVRDSADCLLIVGHNPGIEQLATQLSRDPVKRRERDRYDLLEEKFPTAALAVLDFDILRWRDLAPGQGELTDFVRPRDL